jgi:intron-binding protein aquarius
LRSFGNIGKKFTKAKKMKLIPKENEVDIKAIYTRDFLIELLVCRHGKRDSQLQELNEMPLYPSEDIIWDENIVPGRYFNKLRFGVSKQL